MNRATFEGPTNQVMGARSYQVPLLVHGDHSVQWQVMFDSTNYLRAMNPFLSTRRDEEGETGVITAPKQKTRLKRPRLYKVLLHNDDYTPRSFVVMLLVHIFGKSESDANAIMLKAHNTGISVAGVYTYAIAETKVSEVLAAADKAGFPLLCTMEPEHDGDEGDDDDIN